ncbi:hypothetical protein HanXRQr2_Chr11g0467931 [Helianthus annuus]|uniref:Uncharacterized protein n=1 Tax=Helianthus annuus TaxID=4232 RepID=A0A251T671_HELAN|nr:hypothetical protein HanXRQr2_Chr11g0467931 [Helianthus annuus]
MVTALSFLVDEIWPPYIAKSSGVVERSLAVQRISEENVVSGQQVFISSGSFDSKNQLHY